MMNNQDQLVFYKPGKFSSKSFHKINMPTVHSLLILEFLSSVWIHSKLKCNSKVKSYYAFFFKRRKNTNEEYKTKLE